MSRADDAHVEDLRSYAPGPDLSLVPDILTRYDPDRSWLPYSPDEHTASLFADPSPVIIGGHVLYRHNHHGDITDATVIAIDYDSEPRALINGLLVELPPWPTLTLDTVHGLVRTREARTRGSAGWLPLTWAGIE